MGMSVRESTFCRVRPFALILPILLCLFTLGRSQQLPAANYDESKVGTYSLPNPLVFNDGTPVESPAAWKNRRRAELLELFAANIYGHSPAPPNKLTYDLLD